MIKVIFILFIVLIYNSYAGNTSTYFELARGRTTNIASVGEEDVSFSGDTEIEYLSDTGTYFIIGKKLRKRLSVELMFLNLGQTGYEYDEYFYVKRDTKVAFTNLKLFIGWFTVRFGFGIAKVNTKIKDTSASGASYSIDFESEEETYPASNFALGLNIPFSKSFILYFETNGIAWFQDDKKVEYDDGSSSGSEDLEEVQSFNLLALGIRVAF